MRNPNAKKGQAASAPSADPSMNGNEVQGVFVVRDEKGKLRTRFVPVTTGITGVTNIQVLSGLQAGDEIVTGTFHVLRDLKDNALVKRDNTPPQQPKDSDSDSSSSS